MDMIERLAQFIQSQGLSVRAFELSITASDGMIRRAINNKSDIQSKWLMSIADNYPNLSLDWLIIGRGPMLRAKEQQPIESISSSTTPDVVALRLMDKLDEKDTKIDHLNEELSKTKEELTTIKVQFDEYKTYSEEIMHQLEAGVPEGKTSAKNVFTKKHSSQNADNATSVIAP